MVCLLYAADPMKRPHVWRKVKSYSSSLVFRLSTALFFYKSRDCYHFWPSFVLSFCNQSLLISVSVVWKAAAFTHFHFLVLLKRIISFFLVCFSKTFNFSSFFVCSSMFLLWILIMACEWFCCDSMLFLVLFLGFCDFFSWILCECVMLLRNYNWNVKKKN